MTELYRNVFISVESIKVKPGTTKGYAASFGSKDRGDGNTHCEQFAKAAIDQCKKEIDTMIDQKYGIYHFLVASSKINA